MRFLMVTLPGFLHIAITLNLFTLSSQNTNTLPKSLDYS